MAPKLKLLTLSLIALLLCHAARASAKGVVQFKEVTPTQNGCTLRQTELTALPELFGFRLGMTTDEVKAHVTQVRFPPIDDLGSARTTINPDFDPTIDKGRFKGVRSISLDFLDARLMSLWFGYDATFKWRTVDDFVEYLSTVWKLPNAWGPGRLRSRVLKCADFSLTVSIIAEGPSFRILDTAADNSLAQRREAKLNAEEGAAGSEETSEPVIGDKRNKTYYRPDCLPDKPIAEKDQVVFKNSEAAETAGFKRGQNCQ